MTNRDDARSVFFEAWRKHQEGMPVEPLEAQIIEIIMMHPEYHELLNHPEEYKTADFEETNPFLHISLHLALREQISTNRPNGIATIYAELSQQCQDPHLAEHKMAECLAQIIWDAQLGKTPDEQYYLETLRKIL